MNSSALSRPPPSSSLSSSSAERSSPINRGTNWINRTSPTSPTGNASAKLTASAVGSSPTSTAAAYVGALVNAPESKPAVIDALSPQSFPPTIAQTTASTLTVVPIITNRQPGPPMRLEKKRGPASKPTE